MSAADCCLPSVAALPFTTHTLTYPLTQLHLQTSRCLLSFRWLDWISQCKCRNQFLKFIFRWSFSCLATHQQQQHQGNSCRPERTYCPAANLWDTLRRLIVLLLNDRFYLGFVIVVAAQLCISNLWLPAFIGVVVFLNIVCSFLLFVISLVWLALSAFFHSKSTNKHTRVLVCVYLSISKLTNLLFSSTQVYRQRSRLFLSLAGMRLQKNCLILPQNRIFTFEQLTSVTPHRVGESPSYRDVSVSYSFSAQSFTFCFWKILLDFSTLLSRFRLCSAYHTLLFF